MTPWIAPNMRRCVSCLALCAPLMGHCRPKAAPGRPCDNASGLECVGRDRALTCRAGAWAEMPCRGEAGCARRGGDDDCDDTLANVGDACPDTPARDFACSADHGQALVCEAGSFAVWRECRGARRCTADVNRHLDCDTTLGEPGDPCETVDTYSCSTDLSLLLTCTGTSLVVAATCRGPGRCRFERETPKIECDDSLAVEGDACETLDRLTCGADGKSELVCDLEPGPLGPAVTALSRAGKRYVKRRECRRADCRIDSMELFCD